jgi:hypothetical protein
LLDCHSIAEPGSKVFDQERPEPLELPPPEGDGHALGVACEGGRPSKIRRLRQLDEGNLH